jgi:type I restriction enzyme R subunit
MIVGSVSYMLIVLRKALPNATFIGFTGTPIDKKNVQQQGNFGSYIDKYSIERAVEDGAVVPIHYESRLCKVHVKGDTLDVSQKREH